MKKHNLAIDIFKQLPMNTKRKLNLIDLKSITGAVLITDRIEQFYDACYRHEAALKKFKIEHGYCGGRPYCMMYTKGEICEVCKKEKLHPKYSRKQSEYGIMQAKKRAQIRE